MIKILNITKKAGKQLINIAKHNNTNELLFYVKGGGCNGFNYKLKPVTKENPHDPDKLDEKVIYKCDANPTEQVKITICSSSVFHLLGTKIDWKKDIMGESFHFENPNAASKCGCGTSFSL